MEVEVNIDPPNKREHHSVFTPPPVLADPPTDYQIAAGVVYEKRVVENYSLRSGAGAAQLENDVVEAAVYKAKLINRKLAAAQVGEGQDLPPPWFEGALRNQLNPIKRKLNRIERRADNLEHRLGRRLDEVQNEVRRVHTRLRRVQRSSAATRRMAAILHNQSRAAIEDAEFEVVLFPDLQDPEALGFPLLTSREAIEGLDQRQQQDYYSRYYPGARGDDRHYDRVDKIYEALGIARWPQLEHE